MSNCGSGLPGLVLWILYVLSSQMSVIAYSLAQLFNLLIFDVVLHKPTYKPSDEFFFYNRNFVLQLNF